MVMMVLKSLLEVTGIIGNPVQKNAGVEGDWAR